MNITIKEIKKQYDRIKAAGWLPYFEAASTRVALKGFTTAHLLAIGSRETNLKNIRGDFRGGQYHGFGVMQVDIGTDAEYAKTWTATKVEPSIRRGGEILASKHKDTLACVNQKVKVRSRTFIGKVVEPFEARRIATAAYNCGRWAHYHFSRGENMDSTTTGDDYSRDVYDRAIEFAKLREADGERNAFTAEAALQGAYARSSVIKSAGVGQERTKLAHGTPQEPQEAITRNGDRVEQLEEPASDPPSVAVTDATEAPQSPSVEVKHADNVTAASPPLEGGSKDDPPQQASQGGNKSLVTTIVGGLAGLGTAVGGWFKNEGSLKIIGIVCLTLVILAFMFRQVLLDWLRMKLMADPSKLNVK